MTDEIDDQTASNFFIRTRLSHFPREFKEHEKPAKRDWLPIDTVIERLLARNRPPRINFQDKRHHVPIIKSGVQGPFYCVRGSLAIVALGSSNISREAEELTSSRLARLGDDAKAVQRELGRFLSEVLDELEPRPGRLPGPSVIVDLFRGYGATARLNAWNRLHRDLDILSSAYDALNRLEQRSVRQLRRLSIQELAKGRKSTYWKTWFVAGISQLWENITLHPPSNSPQSLFADFVRACWESIGEDAPEVSFDSTIRRLNISPPKPSKRG